MVWTQPSYANYRNIDAFYTDRNIEQRQVNNLG